jgi:hypothetical protein
MNDLKEHLNSRKVMYERLARAYDKLLLLVGEYKLDVVMAFDLSLGWEAIEAARPGVSYWPHGEAAYCFIKDGKLIGAVKVLDSGFFYGEVLGAGGNHDLAAAELNHLLRKAEAEGYKEGIALGQHALTLDDPEHDDDQENNQEDVDQVPGGREGEPSQEPEDDHDDDDDFQQAAAHVRAPG